MFRQFIGSFSSIFIIIFFLPQSEYPWHKYIYRQHKKCGDFIVNGKNGNVWHTIHKREERNKGNLLTPERKNMMIIDEKHFYFTSTQNIMM